MSRREFEQYAIENNLVVWSREMADRAIVAMQDFNELIRRIEKMDTLITRFEVLRLIDDYLEEKKCADATNAE